MKASLVLKQVDDDDQTPQSFEIDKIITIGRGVGNDICVDDDLLSRNHALIHWVGGEYLVVDLGSSNGTFVNDQPITAPTPLHNNDSVKLGNIVLTFCIDDESHAQQRRQKTTKRVFASFDLVALVSDVRNFTGLSQALPTEGLSALLADWYRQVGTLIHKYNGNIEKIRGDSILAYWIAESDAAIDHHIQDALSAAREMVESSGSFNERMNRDYPGNDFKIGCAIHAGEAVLGNIGADARRDFTTMGDCVNVTFRIESLCGPLDRSVLTSEEIVRRAGEEFSFADLGLHQLKGKPEPMQIFAMLD